MAKKKKKNVTKKRSNAKSSKKKIVKKVIAKRKPKKVSAIPKGYNNITPYLIIDGAVSAIKFYEKAFGAKEKMRLELQPGKIAHAELQFGDTKIMLADECPEMNAQSPHKMKGSPVSIHLYIKDVDKVVKKALSLGAKLIRPVQDMFFGDRSATIQDPSGHIWTVSTHVENVTPAKLKKRMAELFGKQK